MLNKIFNYKSIRFASTYVHKVISKSKEDISCLYLYNKLYTEMLLLEVLQQICSYICTFLNKSFNKKNKHFSAQNMFLKCTK